MLTLTVFPEQSIQSLTEHMSMMAASILMSRLSLLVVIEDVFQFAHSLGEGEVLVLLVVGDVVDDTLDNLALFGKPRTLAPCLVLSLMKNSNWMSLYLSSLRAKSSCSFIFNTVKPVRVWPIACR